MENKAKILIEASFDDNDEVKNMKSSIVGPTEVIQKTIIKLMKSHTHFREVMTKAVKQYYIDNMLEELEEKE